MVALLLLVNVGIIVGKSCYIEDSQDVKVFLRALPIRESTMILCRYMEALPILAITQLYIIVTLHFLVEHSAYSEMMRLTWLSSACFLVYFSIYFFLYFWKNYFYAQNSVYVMVALFFCIGAIGKYSAPIQLDFSSTLPTSFLLVVNLIGLLLYGASYQLAKTIARNA
jgi:ABC-2 type transport system permease protein